MTDFFDDGLKNNPKDVDTLLSKELMRMSLKDRNAIQEEIHGVHCIARNETPELLETSLRQLAVELDQNLAPEETRAYQQSQKLPNTYVNTVGFRLRFLRCELFDAKKAARRMAFILNTVRDLFGAYALERAIRLSDFSKEELKYIRRGRYQWLPFRDRSGRRVVVIFPGDGLQTIPDKIKAKIALYICWTAGNEVETQRMGFVVLVWYDRSFKLGLPRNNKPKLHEITTVRICALHCCTPDTPIHRFQRAVMTMRSAHLRMQLRVHIGNTVELIYILQCYGIPTDTIPITYSGTVKIQGTRQWMRLRAFLEEPIYQNTEEIRSIIECPHPNDIVFRQGTSILAHPGNASFRALIASKVNQIENVNGGDKNNNISQWVNQSINGSKKKKSNKKDSTKIGTRVLVEEVMEEMQRTKRRVLSWNDTQGCWMILKDEAQIYLKVEYLVREHKNAVRANTNRQWSDSSTSMFCRQEDGTLNRCAGKNGSMSKCFGMKYCDSNNQRELV